MTQNNNMKDSKIYAFKNFYPNLLVKKITFVYRQKEPYNHPALGLWWNLNTGIGITNKPQVLKHLMIGLNLFNHITWLEFTYLKKTSKPQKLTTNNLNNYLKNNAEK